MAITAIYRRALKSSIRAVKIIDSSVWYSTASEIYWHCRTNCEMLKIEVMAYTCTLGMISRVKLQFRAATSFIQDTILRFLFRLCKLIKEKYQFQINDTSTVVKQRNLFMAFARRLTDSEQRDWRGWKKKTKVWDSQIWSLEIEGWALSLQPFHSSFWEKYYCKSRSHRHVIHGVYES